MNENGTVVNLAPAPAPELTAQEKTELVLHHIQNCLQGGLWCCSAFIGGVIKGEKAEAHDPENPAQVVALLLGQQLGPMLKEAGGIVLKAALSLAVTVLVGELQGLAASKRN